jgi:hypothetical protein
MSERYEVRTVEADPSTGEVDFYKDPPEPVYYIYDSVKDRPVPFSNSHDEAQTQRWCADRNSRS